MTKMLTLDKPLETLDHDEAMWLLGELDRLRFRILRRLEPAEAAAEPTANLLTIDEAARRLGMSKSWLYRTAHQLPFTVRPNGPTLRFDARGIESYVRQRQGAGG